MGVYVLPELQITNGNRIIKQKQVKCDLCIKINVFHIQRQLWKTRHWHNMLLYL